ncbi:MAG: hypothetical protein U1E78_11875 [Gammaproteobacteria bacterium]
MKHNMCNWQLYVVLDFVDISSNLIHTLRIVAEEGTAKVAEFTLLPFAGEISVSKWIGKPVQIEYVEVDNRTLLFKGVVDEAVYDPTTRLTTFTCTDQLQERVEHSNRAEIDALIGGHWSSVVFDAKSDNWTYARNQLTTVPASLDLDKQNQFRLTSWLAKDQPDFTFTSDDILYQQTSVQLANRRTLHNQVNIDIQYRYQRLKEREIQYEYTYPLSLCDQLHQGATMPNTAMIQQAVSGTGWQLKGSIRFVNQYPGGTVHCNGQQVAFVISNELQQYLVRDASFALTKRFNQTVTEHYVLNLEAPQSSSQIGPILRQEHASLEVPADVDAFKAGQIMVGSITDEAGDSVIEIEDRAALSNLAQTLLHQAKVSILDAHRQNQITFKTILHPHIERHHTVALETFEVKAKGKVRHIIHECDFNQGSSLTTITIAVSRTDSNEEVNESRLGLPVRPSGHGSPQGDRQAVALPRFGGAASSEAFNEDWDGYTGNTQVQPGVTSYPERFVVPTPEIDEAQAPSDVHTTEHYQINIPNEYLILNA